MLGNFSSTLSAANRAVVELKETRKETQAYLAAGQKFLKELEATCVSTDEEHKRQVAARGPHVEAVAKAIEILSFGGIRDLLSMSPKPVDVADTCAAN